GHAGDLVAVRLIDRRTQADRLENLLDLALRERAGRGELLAHRLRAVAAAGQQRAPAEQGVAAFTPVVDPRVLRRDEADGERVRVVEVLRLHDAGGVRDAAGRGVEVVVRERLRERIHARMAADAAVVEHAAVAAGAARDVLPDAIRDDARVLYLLEIHAHVV